MLLRFLFQCKNGAMKKLLLVSGLIVNTIFIASSCSAWTPYTTNGEIYCKDVELIFARGSGGQLGETSEFQELEVATAAIENKFGVSAYVRDLDYPAAEVSTPRQIFESFVSAGKAYSFGNSVKLGVNNLRLYYRAAHKKCPDMKFGFVGYSQGAMVISGAARYFDADSVLFLMMLGDPETYLPEGEGLFPSACFGGERSHWRTYAPNCRTAAGVFGARKPYEASHLKDKYSLWCNRKDYICGSSRNPFINTGHTSYTNYNEIGYGIDFLMERAGYREVPKRSAKKMNNADPPFFAIGSAEAAEELSRVYDDGNEGSELAVPRDITVRRDASSIFLNWKAIPGAKNLLIRFNGVDLGYVDASVGELEIRDVDSSKEYRLELAWMDEAGYVGELAEVEEPEPDDSLMANSIAPVMPNVTYSDELSMLSNTFKANNESGKMIGSGEATSSVSSVSNTESPTDPNKEIRSGFSLMSERDIVNIVLGLLGASGLLLVLFRKKG